MPRVRSTSEVAGYDAMTVAASPTNSSIPAASATSAVADGEAPADVPAAGSDDMWTDPLAGQGVFGQYVQLTKAKLSAFVVMTTALGYVMATPVGGLDWAGLAWTVLGTALCAFAANGLNQVIERRRDAIMRRTRSRPIPAGRMSVRHAFTACLLMAYFGTTILAVSTNLFAAGLAAATIVLYALVYTPLKTRTTMNTLVGAIVGAIPPAIGWVAAAGRMDGGAWVLAMILFVWQIPHFIALAWMYRDDYAAAGYRMLPVLDPDGHLSAQVIITSSLMLMPVALGGVMTGLAGWFYAAGGVLLAGWMAWLGLRFMQERTNQRARKVFFASLVYLPVLMALMIIDQKNSPPPASYFNDDAVRALTPVGPGVPVTPGREP